MSIFAGRRAPGTAHLLDPELIVPLRVSRHDLERYSPSGVSQWFTPPSTSGHRRTGLICTNLPAGTAEHLPSSLIPGRLMRLMSALSISRAIRVGRASDGLYGQDSDLRTATEKGRSV